MIKCVTTKEIKFVNLGIDIPKGTEFEIPFYGIDYSMCYGLKGISSIWNIHFKTIEEDDDS